MDRYWVLVTGGAGYVGSRLVPTLLSHGYGVVVYDTFWFGDYLDEDPALIKVRGDIRDIELFKRAVQGIDFVLHLACISNDPSAELDQDLSRSINLDAFQPLVLAAKAAGVKRFIFCSTSSVYGISDAPNVTEDHPLVPLTLYNTTKAQCEPLLLAEQSDDFTAAIIRPSTICGYSPRQRLDLAVNILTNLAVNKGVITVFGGKQMRPNLHIEDMVDAYLLMLSAPKSFVAGQKFNVGARNYSILELARIVKDIVDEEYNVKTLIDVQPIHDERSYQVDSTKFCTTFKWIPKRSVQNAVRDLCDAFRAGWLPNSLEDPRYFNVKRMREVWADVYKDTPPSAFDPAKGHLSEIDVTHRGAAKEG